LACARQGDGRMAEPGFAVTGAGIPSALGVWRRDWLVQRCWVDGRPHQEFLDPARCLHQPQAKRSDGVDAGPRPPARGARWNFVQGRFAGFRPCLMGLICHPIGEWRRAAEGPEAAAARRWTPSPWRRLWPITGASRPLAHKAGKGQKLEHQPGGGIGRRCPTSGRTACSAGGRPEGCWALRCPVKGDVFAPSPSPICPQGLRSAFATSDRSGPVPASAAGQPTGAGLIAGPGRAVHGPWRLQQAGRGPWAAHGLGALAEPVVPPGKGRRRQRAHPRVVESRYRVPAQRFPSVGSQWRTLPKGFSPCRSASPLCVPTPACPCAGVCLTVSSQACGGGCQKPFERATSPYWTTCVQYRARRTTADPALIRPVALSPWIGSIRYQLRGSLASTPSEGVRQGRNRRTSAREAQFLCRGKILTRFTSSLVRFVRRPDDLRATAQASRNSVHRFPNRSTVLCCPVREEVAVQASPARNLLATRRARRSGPALTFEGSYREPQLTAPITFPSIPRVGALTPVTTAQSAGSRR